MISLETPVESKITDLRQRIASFTGEPLTKYPGVTRTLSGTKDYTGINAWRDRVGHDVADAIVEESKSIGNSLDNMFNRSLQYSDFDPEAHRQETGYALWKQLAPKLEKIVPIAVQQKVWSDHLKVLGYIDCLGYYDGVLSLIDCKNSRSEKNDVTMYDYHLQCTAYSMCLYDMFGLEVKQNVLLIARRDFVVPQVSIQPNAEFVAPVIKRIRDYHSQFN